MTRTETSAHTEVAIVGAGPYGLSLAAHLRHAGVPHRIFGHPMHSWQHHMPKGMCLKSDGFASSLYDPEDALTLARYCEEKGLPYQYSGLPVPLETFVAYGLAFAERLVPQLEPVDIRHITQCTGGFELTTATGERFRARRVVLAVGIKHFGYTPPQLVDLPAHAMTHSSEHGDLSRFRGRRVLVVGAGASAIDMAAALADAGADTHLIGRREKVGFYTPDLEPRPLKQRIFNPRSAIGLGWKYVLCTSLPLLFHAMPQRFRHRVVQRHLGPSPAWFMRDKIDGRIPMHLGAQLTRAEVLSSSQGTTVRVHYRQHGQPGEQQFLCDHVIAATGYRAQVQALPFLTPELVAAIRTAPAPGPAAGTPVLNRSFETSVPGLHMVGLASANHFGPMCRFACGARFTARHLTRFLRRRTAAARVTSSTPRAEPATRAPSRPLPATGAPLALSGWALSRRRTRIPVPE
ncbi:MAG TPA: NAD(P)-binding domain-containing protein [Acidobacteriaceae bacterium]